MKKTLIAIIDYGMGNLRSVSKALEYSGARTVISDKPAVIRSAAAVVFPGVGSFGPAVKYLKQKGLDETISGVIGEGKAFLGLCLGFQLLFDFSVEGGMFKGLGVVRGKVDKFSNKLTVPHMGWNSVKQQSSDSAALMFKGIADNSYFYFVHSYYGKPSGKTAVAGITEYGVPFCSAIAAGRVWACQFHPEKSGANGLRLLKNFVLESKK